jgi:hypothetical protein
MPIAQVLVSAAAANPAPMPAASHLSLGAAMLPRTLDSAIQVPPLGASAYRKTHCLPVGYPAVEDVHIGQTGGAQRPLGLSGALPRAAHQDDVIVEVLDDLVAVLAQYVERNVVGTGNVHRLELAGGSDVEHSRGHRRLQ